MKTGVFWVATLQIMIALGVFLTGACTPPVQYPQLPPNPRTGENPRNRNNNNDDRRDRERAIDSRERTGECAENRQCQKICNDIFKSRKDREECEEFSIADVESMEDVFNILDDPDEDDLADMDLSDLDFMLGINISPLEDAVDDMSPSEKKDFQAWLAGDSEAMDIIADAEDEFEIFKELFGSNTAAIIASLNKSVDSGDNFVEVALEEGNDVALEWLHDYFGEDCDKDRYETCIFKKYYCELNLTGDFEEEYFDYEFFEDILDTVLDSERNSSHSGDAWGSSADTTYGEWPEGTEASDLDKWKSSPHNMCNEIDPAHTYASSFVNE